jgi:hypothetical protein
MRDTPVTVKFIALSAILLLLNSPLISEAATIVGVVHFNGPTPSLRPIQVSKDQDYCGQTLPDESLLISGAGGLKNVVVSIDAPAIRPAFSTKINYFDTNGCSFVPRVSAMMLGERLVLKNSDPKLHIAHSYLDKITVFNVAVPFKNHQMELTKKILKAGLLDLNCDTHAWMHGYIHVFEHPFFAVTSETGTFAIPNVPAGRYALKSWHEKAGVQTTEIAVPEEGEIVVNVEVGK